MKNKKCGKRFLCVLSAAAIMLYFFSCKTAPKKIEAASVTFFIVDENDRAVPDFEICLWCNEKGECVKKQSGLTNETGFCTFYNLSATDYFVSGEKTGFTTIDMSELNIQKASELICFRVLGADFVLDQIEQFCAEGQYQKALEWLQALCTQQNSDFQNSVELLSSGLQQRINLSRQDKNQDLYKSDPYQDGVQ